MSVGSLHCVWGRWCSVYGTTSKTKLARPLFEKHVSRLGYVQRPLVPHGARNCWAISFGCFTIQHSYESYIRHDHRGCFTWTSHRKRQRFLHMSVKEWTKRQQFFQNCTVVKHVFPTHGLAHLPIWHFFLGWYLVDREPFDFCDSIFYEFCKCSENTASKISLIKGFQILILPRVNTVFEIWKKAEFEIILDSMFESR